MNVSDLKAIVKGLGCSRELGQLGKWTMAVEEDGTATLYPLGKWKDRLVLRIGIKDGLLHVLACNPKDWNDCGGQAARTRREAWELVRQYLELYGG